MIPVSRSRPVRSVLAALGSVVVAVALAAVPASAQQAVDATPTRLLVRAVAHDAKVIGSGVGGARITVRDAETGEILARGLQRGGTGDTDRIMHEPVERGEAIYDTGGTVGYRTTLMLEGPTRVEVAAEGPMAAAPAARQTARKTLWMLPGRDVVGQGVVLELHGFFVEILAPADRTVPPGELAVRARIRMMCGCPTEPGGLWDSDRYEMRVRLLRDGRVLREAPMRFAGETSRYEATLPVEREGDARVEVLVADTARANLGRAVRAIRVERP